MQVLSGGLAGVLPGREASPEKTGGTISQTRYYGLGSAGPVLHLSTSHSCMFVPSLPVVQILLSCF